MTAAPDDGIETSILTFLREELSLEVTSAETNLIETGILDSLILVDLLHYAETRFDIVISLDDLEIENFVTVANMASFVAARRSTGDGGS